MKSVLFYTKILYKSISVSDIFFFYAMPNLTLLIKQVPWSPNFGTELSPLLYLLIRFLLTQRNYKKIHEELV